MCMCLDEDASVASSSMRCFSSLLLPGAALCWLKLPSYAPGNHRGRSAAAATRTLRMVLPRGRAAPARALLNDRACIFVRDRARVLQMAGQRDVAYPRFRAGLCEVSHRSAGQPAHACCTRKNFSCIELPPTAASVLRGWIQCI